MSDTVKECPVCGYHFWELVGCPNGCKTANDNNDRVQSLCETCNMVNCKIKRDWGVVAVKCNEYMEA